MYRAIRDYAIIGNLKSAALVSKDGSIDWAPAPFIDSSSIFGGILDEQIGGHFSIQPVGEFESSQRYIPKTNILVTEFQTAEGTLEITDFVPVEKDKEIMVPEERAIFEIYRKAACTKGRCRFRVEFMPRFDYAQSEMEILKTNHGLFAGNRKKNGVLISGLEYDITEEGVACAEGVLEENDERHFIFRYNTTNMPENHDLNFELELMYTKMYWERWLDHCDFGTCNFTTHWHEQVERSTLLLKILFFEPTGAVAAAPTTSLPEEIGGVRNWDYRYSWVRDAAFTLQALLDIGHYREADKYMRWLMEVSNKDNALIERPESLQIMYSLRGEAELQEQYLTHLAGYKNSKPVRIGNRAYEQKQLDVYGGILNTVWRMCQTNQESKFARNNWEGLRSLADYTARVWEEPDEGLWEVRGGRKHFTYSKLMCWVALDRAEKLSREYRLEGDTKRWGEEKEKIREAINEKGWSKEKRAFAQSFGSPALDTALLRMPALGFIEGDDPRMLSTIEQIEAELSIGDGLFYRYKTEDGLPGREGAFLLASFWFVDALVYAGEAERAATMFEKILAQANHVGLFAEEVDVRNGQFLGNFPQAYTHIGLINSAFNISRMQTAPRARKKGGKKLLPV